MPKTCEQVYADVAALTSVPAGDSGTVRRAYHGKATVHMTQGKGYRLAVEGQESGVHPLRPRGRCRVVLADDQAHAPAGQ
jgi:hypothetical protein